MADNTIDISLKSSFDAAGTNAATKAFEQLQAARSKANSAGGAASADTGNAKLAQSAQKAAQEVTKAEAAFLRAARAEASLASASGNAAGGIAILSNALTQVDRTSLAAVGAQTQLQRAIMATEKASQQAASGGQSLASSFGTLASAAGGLGIAVGAQQIIQGGIALTQTGATALQTAERFHQLAAAAGQSGDSILKVLRAASGGQISDMNLELAANRANLLGVATSADQMATLMEIARDRAQSLGTTATEAFNDLVTGLGRGSPLILDNLGIMVDIKGANEAYAASVGKTVAQLTEAEKKQALINQVVADGKAKLEETGGAADTAAGKFAALGVAAENAGTRMGSGLATALTPAAEGATALLDMANSGENLNNTLGALAGSIVQFAGGTQMAADSAQQSTVAVLEWGQALVQSAQNTQDYIDRLHGIEPAHQAAANAAAIDAVETQRLTREYDNSAAVAATLDSATQEVASTLGEAATKTQETADKATILRNVQQDLANIGAAVASGHMTAANGAAILEGRYGMAAAQAERLIADQARLAGNNTRIAEQGSHVLDLTGGNGIARNAVGRAGMGDADILSTVTAATKENAAAKDAAAAAQRRLNEVTGGATVVMAGLRSDLGKATVGSAAYIDILAKIATEEQKASKAGGARGAAAEKVANKLVSIEQSAAAKIMAINERLADAQIAAARKLASDISTSTADMIADQEADDLDLIGAKEENMDKLRSREQAEGQARVAQAAAVSEAQARAAAGDAETAGAVLDIREEQIGKQQKLDEDYANKRVELADSPEELDALKGQYDEATQAYADAAGTRVALAEAEAAQKKIKADEEKNAAIAAATEAATALAATGKSAGSARDQVDAMIGRLHAIPTDVTTTVHVNTVNSGGSGGTDSSTGSSAASSAGGSAAMAGGGTLTGVTSGPMHVTLGDNPGGKEAYAIHAVPLSGTGVSRASSGHLALAGGTVGQSADEARAALDAANARAAALAGQLPKAVAAHVGKGGGGSGSSDPGDVLSAIDKAISVLDKIASLRDKLAEIGPPIDLALVNTLADEALAATQIMGARWVRITKDSEDEFKRFASTIENALGVLDKAAGLRKSLTEIGPPLDMDTVAQLAYEAEQALFGVRRLLRPIGEREADEIKRFTESAGAAIGLLADASKLSAKEFSDYQPPSERQIARFAHDADTVVKAIYNAARVYDTDGLDAANTYADALGKTFGSLTDGLKFVEALNTGDYAIDMAKLGRFTSDSMKLLDRTAVIGAKAATIPVGDITAINAAAGALTAYGDSMIKIAAVPDIQSMSGYAGGGSTSNTNMGGVNIVINPPAGMDISALANLVISRLNSAVGSHR